jgi:hypothetical protein
MLLAMRRASSCVSRWAAVRRPGATNAQSDNWHKSQRVQRGARLLRQANLTLPPIGKTIFGGGSFFTGLLPPNLKLVPVRFQCGWGFSFEPRGTPSAAVPASRTRLGPRARVRVRNEDAQPLPGKRLRHCISIAIGD